MIYAKSRGTCPTIGLLTYGTRDTIAADMWSAVSDIAREQGVNALCFPGGSPHERIISTALSEVVFDLAGNEAREFYGLERLCQVVSAHWEGTAEAVKNSVIADVKAFIGNQKVYDDITLVVVKQR